MDLKVWDHNNNIYILYLIDVFTRYTVAVVINRKLPDTIINAVMKAWVQYFGVMGEILTDNGGEFSCKKYFYTFFHFLASNDLGGQRSENEKCLYSSTEYLYKVSLSSDDPKSTNLPNATDGRTDRRTDKASYRVASLLKNWLGD